MAQTTLCLFEKHFSTERDMEPSINFWLFRNVLILVGFLRVALYEWIMLC